MNGGEDRGDKRTRQCGSSRKKSDLAGPHLRPPVGLLVVDVVLSRQRWLALLLVCVEKLTKRHSPGNSILSRVDKYSGSVFSPNKERFVKCVHWQGDMMIGGADTIRYEDSAKENSHST